MIEREGSRETLRDATLDRVIKRLQQSELGVGRAESENCSVRCETAQVVGKKTHYWRVLRGALHQSTRPVRKKQKKKRENYKIRNSAAVFTRRYVLIRYV